MKASNQFLFTKNIQELKGMLAKNKKGKGKISNYEIIGVISDVSVRQTVYVVFSF